MGNIKSSRHWEKYRHFRRDKWKTPQPGNPFGFVTYEKTPSLWTENILGNLWQLIEGN